LLYNLGITRMFNYFFNFTENNIVVFIDELKYILNYFFENWWLGCFFIMQILLLRFIKNRGDYANILWRGRQERERGAHNVKIDTFKNVDNFMLLYYGWWKNEMIY